MNIFFLSDNPYQAAMMLCDKHLSKMQLESAQILSTACHVLGLDTTGLYKPTHRNHPSTVWARVSKSNMRWLAKYVYGMDDEWQARGHKQHKSFAISQLAIDKLYVHSGYEHQCCTDVPLCMPELYWPGASKYVPLAEAPAAYRKYYAHDKAYMATWPTYREPDWWQRELCRARLS